MILHFVGGPLDGRMYQWPDAPPTFYLPAQPVLRFSAADTADEPLLPETIVYVRRRGVVAGEAIYDWQRP